ncbi:MAG: hypothetical protein NTV07_00250 [Candidatus Omnitrophica bacterium]|nr:hypothetical protein [Candidatus Omnitrophota bacterium]
MGKKVIKKIIFIVERSFDFRDYQRYGIDLLRSNGFDVEVWDLTPALHPHMPQTSTDSEMFNHDKAVIFKNKEDAFGRISNLSKTDFVVNCVGYRFYSLGVYRALFKSGSRYAFEVMNSIPVPVVKKNMLNITLRRMLSYRRITPWQNLFMELPFKFLGVKPADLLFVGGEKYHAYRYPVSKSTEILWGHALDYDLFLSAKDKTCSEKPIAVFLDQFLPFHSDYIREKQRPPMTPYKYYGILNDFFDRLETKTGLEVVIAAHPRSHYEDMPDYFHGRNCVKGKTIELVRGSQLVINHCTTAVNFANLFYKPLIFITCKALSNTYEDIWTRVFAEWHGKKPVFMEDKNIDFKKELKVSKAHYANYRKAYIKTEGSEDLPFWQIVSNRLKKGI